MLYRNRISVAIGFMAMLVAFLVGTDFGAAAGALLGGIAAILMWLTDMLVLLSQLFLLLLTSYVFPQLLEQLAGLNWRVYPYDMDYQRTSLDADRAPAARPVSLIVQG